MKTLFLDEIRDCIGARLQAVLPVVNVTGVSTDSRTLKHGDIFFAIRGPTFDGHDFAPCALSRGASGVVVDKSYKLPDGMDASRFLWADDTIIALGKLAAYYRNELPCTIIAVTGSNGKTTTREMIYHVLSKKFRGRRSQKSFNNHIGVPLTVLSSDMSDEFLIVEVGSNHPGEIDYLGSIISPNISVVTNVGESHLEGFGSVDRVAIEKASLAKHVRSGGLIVANGDRELLLRLVSNPHAMIVSFGNQPHNDMRITSLNTTANHIRFQVNDHFNFDLPVIGGHNALNALAAIVVARRMGFDMNQIADAFNDFVLPSMRLEQITFGKITVLNDAYNANPSSMRAAIDVLRNFEWTGRKVFFFGQMMELGDASQQLHCDLVKNIMQANIDVVVFVGEYAKIMCKEAIALGMNSKKAFAFPTTEKAADEIHHIIADGDLILMKGSRTMKMETIIGKISELNSE
jgi:UDP-N-acetylmuramoyl-tripeptide--D-alanyl-D-alanine ligase